MGLIEAFRALPDDEGKLRRELSDGSDAARFLNDGPFKNAVQRLRDGIYGDFAASTPDMSGDEARRNARMKLALVDQILKDLRQTEQTGKLAETQLGLLDRMRKRLKS